MIIKGKNILEGTNDLDSHSLFEERKEYKLFVEIPQSIDLWYRNYLYGRVDQKRNPYSLSESNLKQVNADNKTIFIIDFVADAFKDMRNYYSQAVLQKRVVLQGTIIKDLEPKKGWISSNSIYHAHMEIMYGLFVVLYLIGKRKEQDVSNFDDFLNEFLFFIQTQKKMPFTKAGFMLSNFCVPLVSGLALELNVDKNYPEDKVKQKFMEDPNFEFYKKALRRHGFLIDKNVPWRIYANLNSNIMKTYATKYGLGKGPTFIQDFFDAYYYDLTLSDIDIFKNYMVHFYNSFIVAYPNIKKVGCKGKTTLYKTNKRQEITIGSLDNNLFWFKYYCLIRIQESEKIFNETEKYNILKKAIEMYNYLDIEKALGYINKTVG